MNKKGDVPTTIFVVEVLLILCIALLSFIQASNYARGTFVGIRVIDKLNAEVEKNAFYEKNPSYSGRDLKSILQSISDNQQIVSGKKCNCGYECDIYADNILKYSSENGIEPMLVLALIMQESISCKKDSESDSSAGLMQINLIHCGNYGLPENKNECKKILLTDMSKNIEVGTKMLKEFYEQFKDGKDYTRCSGSVVHYAGWEAALRRYNGWGCNKNYPAQDTYVEDVIERYETLKGNYFEAEKADGIWSWSKKEPFFSVKYIPTTK
jgi:hypothetical protein